MRKNIIALFLINIVIRIPRMLSPQGLDGFYVVWESELFLRGEYFKKGFDFYSLLGLHPSSGYPILTLLIMSFFL